MKLDSPLINILIKTCLKACKSLIRDFGEIENLQVSSKGPGDFVSSSDKRTEEIIINELQKARPDFEIISEESGLIKNSNSEKKMDNRSYRRNSKFLKWNSTFCYLYWL